MSFKDPLKIQKAIGAMREASSPRSRNRARINSVFNGDPPYTDAEARDNSIDTNVNFLEGTRIISQARQQFVNAFMKPSKYFSSRLDVGNRQLREGWGITVTHKMNRILKRTQKYMNVLENQFASVVLHGVGAATWMKSSDWCPVFRGVDDMMIPTNTLQSLENLDHFAVRMNMTLADIMRQTKGPNVQKGWQMDVVKQIVQNMLKNETNTATADNYSDYTNFEKIQEDFKENSGFWGSDAAPTVKCFDFYYLDTSKEEQCWRRKIVLDEQSTSFETTGLAKNQVLFDGGNKDYGKEISRIMHVQFADGAVVPPFRWHSVRSLGYLLYAVCNLQNRVRCRVSDSIFEHLNWYFIDVTDSDTEKLTKVDLRHLGIIPSGLKSVTGPERHRIDPNLIERYMSSNRQLMAESAANYVQDQDSGNSTPPTATQIMAQVNAANALIGSMLTRAYNYQLPGYREVARRFCTSDNKECIKFRKECIEEGVPAEVFNDFDAWDIEVETVMGSGNKMMAVAQADRLLSILQTLDPGFPRREVLRRYVEATTDDPKLAQMLIPIEQAKNTPTVEKASMSWGTIMTGQPVIFTEPFDRQEAIMTLMGMLDTEIQQTAQLPKIDIISLQGLSNAVETIEAMLADIAQDPTLEAQVGQWSSSLQKAKQAIEQMYAQWQKDQSEAGGEMDPELQAKIQAQIITAQSKAQIAERSAEQKRAHKEAAFIQDQNRKDVKTASDVATTDLKTKADIARENLIAASQPQEPTNE